MIKRCCLLLHVFCHLCVFNPVKARYCVQLLLQSQIWTDFDQVSVRITALISPEAAQLYLILHQSCFSLKSDHQDLLRSVYFFISQSLHYMFGSISY